jgi:hypothetical protein
MRQRKGTLLQMFCIMCEQKLNIDLTPAMQQTQHTLKYTSKNFLTCTTWQ